MFREKIYENEQIAKKTVKDSVFTSLFREKKYLLQLYRSLHPEDTETTEEDLADITIKNILVDGIYNDLGFIAADRLMILVEAQSTWTMNIVVRAFLYLAKSWQDYIDKENMDLYGSKKVKLPKPELYVIFTGERTDKPDVISLTDEFFPGEGRFVDIRTEMIYRDDAWRELESGEEKRYDIISQYILFSKIYDRQRKLYGRTRKTVTETIRICESRDVLKEYLKSRKKEVVDIMMTLFDEERILQIHVDNKIKENTEKVKKDMVKQMLKAGYSVEEIAKIVGLQEEEIRHIGEEQDEAV